MKLNDPIRQYLADNITLGSLIDKLSGIDPMQTIWFDFPNARPDGLSLYYSIDYSLCVNYRCSSDRRDLRPVGWLLRLLRENLGSWLPDRNGSRIEVTGDMKLWVANPGEVTGTAVVGVIKVHGAPILLTSYRREGLGSLL